MVNAPLKSYLRIGEQEPTHFVDLQL